MQLEFHSKVWRLLSEPL